MRAGDADQDAGDGEALAGVVKAGPPESPVQTPVPLRLVGGERGFPVA